MEDRPEYITESQYAAIIESPRTIKTLSDKGLVYSKAWGWVKTSAKFISHIKELRGAKLAIWMTIALSIDESGTCKLTIKDLCELTGYSHTEVIDSLKELSTAGYLGINKDQRGNIYTPEFVARGENVPSETLVKKVDSTPVYQVESTLSEENVVPSIKELKELKVKPDLLDGILSAELNPKSIREALKQNFAFNTKWETKTAKEWMEWAVGQKITPEQIKQAANTWRNDKKFNWKHPSLQMLFEWWPALMEASTENGSGTPEPGKGFYA